MSAGDERLSSQRAKKPGDLERYAYIKELFLRLIDLDPEERPQFLEEVCGNDSELRTELGSLLKHHRPSDRSESSTEPAS